jgi:hypothetical protein
MFCLALGVRTATRLNLNLLVVLNLGIYVCELLLLRGGMLALLGGGELARFPLQHDLRK